MELRCVKLAVTKVVFQVEKRRDLIASIAYHSTKQLQQGAVSAELEVPNVPGEEVLTNTHGTYP